MKQVALCGSPQVVELCLPDSCPDLLVNEPPGDAAGRRVLSHLLLDACAEVMKLGISRLVWPIHSGAASEADLRTDVLADACDRSLLAGQLASLDAPRTGPGSRGVRIETPYADLTDRQMAEIVIDLGAPVAACWWCETSAERACAACRSCVRWSNAWKRAGARLPVGR
jgi:hypothetical protein